MNPLKPNISLACDPFSMFQLFKKTEYFLLSLAGNVVITYLQTEHYIQTVIVSFLYEQSALTGFLFGMSSCIRVDNLMRFSFGMSYLSEGFVC